MSFFAEMCMATVTTVCPTNELERRLRRALMLWKKCFVSAPIQDGASTFLMDIYKRTEGI